MVRGSCDVPVMAPNDFEVTDVDGSLNCGWFNALMNSARNCRLMPSCSLVFFKAERSIMLIPGPRIPEKREESTRTSLARWSAVLVSKMPVLNH